MQTVDFNIARVGEWSSEFGAKAGTWLRENGPKYLEAAQDPANLVLAAVVLAGIVLSTVLAIVLVAKILRAIRDALYSRPGEAILGVLRERPLHYLINPAVRLNWKDRVEGGLQMVGPPGSGKTVLCLIMAITGLLRGRTVVVFEHDGDLAERLAAYAGRPLRLFGKGFVFDPADSMSMKWNPLAGDREQVIQQIVDTISSVSDSHEFYQNLDEDVCRNLVALALVYAGYTGQQPHMEMLLDFLSDHESLEDKLHVQRDGPGKVRVSAPFVEGKLKTWLEQEFLVWDQRTRIQYLLGLRNLLRKLLSGDKVVEALTPEPGEATLHLGEALSSGGLVVFKASSKDLGSESSQFLLSCGLQILQQESLARSSPRRPVEVYVDEAHAILGQQNTKVAESFGRWVVQARKYNVAAHIGHQSFAQLPKTLQGTLDSSMRNKVIFGGLHGGDARHAQALLGHTRRRKVEYRDMEGAGGARRKQKITHTVEEPYYPLSEIESLPKRRVILRATRGEVQLPPRTLHVSKPLSIEKFIKKYLGGRS